MRVLLLLFVLGAASGCAASRDAETSPTTTGIGRAQQLTRFSTAGLYIYDAAGKASVAVTPSDVIRSTVHLAHSSTGAEVVGGLTRRGSSRFCALTRALAHRGARLHRPQRIAFQVDGVIYARPYIDYRVLPNGICGSPAFEFASVPQDLARTLVKRIRSG